MHGLIIVLYLAPHGTWVSVDVNTPRNLNCLSSLTTLFLRTGHSNPHLLSAKQPLPASTAAFIVALSMFMQKMNYDEIVSRVGKCHD